MTSGHTYDEWLTILEQAENGISSTSQEYKAPGPETEDFAKSIDHTLLKLEATQSQVDALCEEARKHNFKVTIPPFFKVLCLCGYVHHLSSLVPARIEHQYPLSRLGSGEYEREKNEMLRHGSRISW